MKKIDLNSSFVAGVISILILAFEAFGLYVSLSTGLFGFSFGDIILILGFIHIFHKTLWKKQRLTNWEWLGFSILVIWFLVTFMIGFAIGYSGGVF